MIGVWTGNGFTTIVTLLPPRHILGYYDGRVKPPVRVELPAPLPPEQPMPEPPSEEEDEDIPFVIL